MLEITTFLLYCCLCTVCVCGIIGMVCLTYVYASNMIQEHKHNKRQMEKLDDNY